MHPARWRDPPRVVRTRWCDPFGRAANVVFTSIAQRGLLRRSLRGPPLLLRLRHALPRRRRYFARAALGGTLPSAFGNPAAFRIARRRGSRWRLGGLRLSSLLRPASFLSVRDALPDLGRHGAASTLCGASSTLGSLGRGVRTGRFSRVTSVPSGRPILLHALAHGIPFGGGHRAATAATRRPAE